MKRGFLNTQKAKQRVAEPVVAESTGETPHKESRDKDKKGERLDSDLRSEYAEINAIDPHKLPKSIQEEVDQDKHCVGYGKNRIIFRVWPRDPNGDVMTSALRGKQAGNGIEMWGATLYDFYHVKRFPSVPGYISSSTGSRISKWMRQVGELIADDELYWADNEEDPKEIPVADIGELISCYDRRVALGIFNRFSSRKEIRKKGKSGWSIVNYNDLTKATDEGGLTSPIGDQGDNMGTEQGAKQQTGKPLPKIDSPFHPVHYPSPYPFIPCTHDGPPILQQRVPLHLLPQKLHVHDPWNKLTVLKGDLDHTTPWLSKVANGRGITRTYSLSLAPRGKKAALKAQKLAEMAEDKEAKQKRVLRIFPADKEGPMKEPLIEVVLPPQPRKRAQVEEAHLYLSPYPVGVGNHSVVHSAEWELPRDLFVEARLCRACVEEDVRQQVQKLKDEGKWEALLKDPTEKPEETLHSDPGVSPGTEPSQASGPKRTVRYVTIQKHRLPEVTGSYGLPGDEKSAGTNDTESGPSSDGVPPADAINHAAKTGGTETDAKIDAVDRQDLEPGTKFEKNWNCKEPSAGSAPREDKGEGKGELEQDDGDEEKADAEESEEQSEEELFFIEHPGVIRIASDYAGPAIRVHTTVKWRGPSEAHCKHGSFDSGPLPRTAIVRVVAKLSIPGDLHLAREAKNYQSFPDHFFQHWNGYNITPPLHDPVPVGALCPQFYGYYEPDDPIDGTKSDQCDYLSPILLMEHCGRKVDPEALCLDDKQGCASPVLRFHHAGWLHESFAARNILWQQGKPTEWPIERQSSVKKSFRLIDFGRSKKLDCAISERMTEGEIAFRLLHLLHHGVGR